MVMTKPRQAHHTVFLRNNLKIINIILNKKHFTSSSILRNSFPARDERRDHLPVGSATIEGLRDRGLRDSDMGGDMSSSSERRSSPDRVRDSE